MTFEGDTLFLGAGTILAKGASPVSSGTDDVKSRDTGRRVALLTAAQLTINRAVGKAFEEKVQKDIAGSGQMFAPQITIKTDSGIKVRGDFLSMDPETGAIGATRAKGSATAPLTTNQ